MGERTFRVLLTVCWMTLLGTFIAGLTKYRALPPELVSYLRARSHTPHGMLDYIIMVVAVVGLGACVVSYIGLYFWKAWARRLFVLIIMLGFGVGGVHTTPVVFSSVYYVFYTTNSILIGLLVGCMYYDPLIRSKYEAKDGVTKGNPT